MLVSIFILLQLLTLGDVLWGCLVQMMLSGKGENLPFVIQLSLYGGNASVIALVWTAAQESVQSEVQYTCAETPAVGLNVKPGFSFRGGPLVMLPKSVRVCSWLYQKALLKCAGDFPFSVCEGMKGVTWISRAISVCFTTKALNVTF